MSAKEIDIKGSVESVNKSKGKLYAKVVISVPVNSAGEIPLGEVNIKIQTLQNAMFGDAPGGAGGNPRKGKIRG